MIRRFQQYEPQISSGAYVAQSAQVIGRVALAAGASVWDGAVLRGDIDDIVIGENSNVQDNSVIHNSQGMPVVVGRNVTIGHRVVLHSCSIGDNSLIGMGAVLLDGVKVGNNCLIGAGALVTPNTVIPDGMMALGSPAKVVKPLSDAVLQANIENADEYVRLAGEYSKNDEAVVNKL